MIILFIAVVFTVIIHNITGRKQCPAITINNGHIMKEEHSWFSITCNPGFSLVGRRNIRCLRSGQFNFYSKQPLCVSEKKNSCPKVEIAYASIRKVRRGRRIFFNIITCKRGYVLIGRRVVVCRRGQILGRTMPICRKKLSPNCPDPGTPINGISIKYGEHQIGSRVRFWCNEGFRLVGPEQRKCLSNRQWSFYQPSCVKKSNIMDVARELKENFIDKFELFTNTSKSRVDAAGRGLFPGTRGLDIVFLLDRSSSIDEVDFQHGLNFTKYIVKEFGVSNKKGGTRVAIVTFGTKAQLELSINDKNVSTTEDVLKKLDSIKASGGGTNMKEAFEIISIDLLPQLNPEAKKVIFMISDGRSNAGAPDALAKTLRKDHAFEIFAVGIGNGVDKNQLSTVASHPYTNHVFLLKDYESLSMLTDVIVDNTTEYTKCGVAGDIEVKKGTAGRSVGGAESTQGAWPWVAAIYHGTNAGSQFQCGGALICENWIMTAAHCLEKRLNDTHFKKLEPDEIDSVWLGEYDRRQKEGTEQVRVAVEVIQHPMYNPHTHAYDIGLVKLDPYAPAILNKWVRTICLPSLNDGTSLAVRRPNYEGYVAGWGTTAKLEQDASDDSKYNPSWKIRQVKLPVVDRKSCKQTLDNFGEELKEHMFCAGFRYVLVDACRGDTGSPYVGQRDDFRFTALGIVSWKDGCAVSNRYGVYTSVADFIPWVNKLTDSCNAKYK